MLDILIIVTIIITTIIWASDAVCISWLKISKWFKIFIVEHPTWTSLPITLNDETDDDKDDTN